MISIIICSRESTINVDLAENIKKTVGCKYELIIVDNSENQYSIFEAYNVGIEKSASPYLCFLHDDIKIHSIGWGNTIICYFKENQKIGLIGVAGSKIKTKMPSAWWEHDTKFLVKYIIQHYPDKKPILESLGFANTNTEEVVIIDGVFMAIRKDDHIRFEENLTGFHNYDQSISLNVRNLGYKVIVTKEILIEHFSPGNVDETWIGSTLQFHQLYKDKLPQSVEGKVTRRDEAKSCLSFINNCRYTWHKRTSFKFWIRYFVLNPFSNQNKFFLKYYIKAAYKRK
tara:strand:+ start:8075 stop:8929 length:855 start_codon:yes stop_codon:yes gene_type:complete